MGKTEVMIIGRDIHISQTSGTHLCKVCRKGVGKKLIFCRECLFWIHEKCSDILGRLVEDDDLDVEGGLVMHGQLMEDLVLKSNLLMAKLM